MGTILGIVRGNTGHFDASTTPVGSSLQPGNIPVWTSDDPHVTLTPSANGLSVDAATLVGDAQASVNLTITGVSFDASTISATVNVPLSDAPPPPVPATGFDINQTS